jgi:hypothetical protein
VNLDVREAAGCVLEREQSKDVLEREQRYYQGPKNSLL